MIKIKTNIRHNHVLYTIGQTVDDIPGLPEVERKEMIRLGKIEVIPDPPTAGSKEVYRVIKEESVERMDGTFLDIGDLVTEDMEFPKSIKQMLHFGWIEPQAETGDR